VTTNEEHVNFLHFIKRTQNDVQGEVTRDAKLPEVSLKFK